MECPESDELIRIACVGDSLTRGDGLHEHIPANRVPFQRLRPSQYALRKRGSYPALLARLAATQRAVVRNFGHGGATACNNSGGNGPPYESVPEYSAALRFAPHVVILMLGTNDAKAHFWSARVRAARGGASTAMACAQVSPPYSVHLSTNHSSSWSFC